MHASQIRENSQNFAAFSEYMNFMRKWSWAMHILELSIQNENYDSDQIGVLLKRHLRSSL